MIPELLFDSHPYTVPTLYVLVRFITQPVISYLLSRFIVMSGKVSVSQQRVVAQRLTRTVCGMLLFLMAAFVLYTEPALWESKWLASSPRAESCLRGLLAYLVADSVELLYAKVTKGCPTQPDLLVHHVAGLVMFNIMINPEFCGLWFSLMCILSEILTLFSGLVFFCACADHFEHPWAHHVLQACSRGRLWCLVFFRGPLWLTMNTYLIKEWNWPTSTLEPERQKNMLVQIALFIVYGLDTYWTCMLLGFFKSKGELRKSPSSQEVNGQCVETKGVRYVGGAAPDSFDSKLNAQLNAGVSYKVKVNGRAVLGSNKGSKKA